MSEFFLTSFKMDSTINETLLFLTVIILIFTCYKLIISKNLIESLIITSIFSLIISLCYLLMDAPDVAMTEVSLGAALSTCVMLNVINITGQEYKPCSKIRIITASILCILFILILAWVSLDFAEFGSHSSPVQEHLTKYYIQNTKTDIDIPSFTAAVLASYRGFDTLGETTVILIAGLAVLLITSRRKA